MPIYKVIKFFTDLQDNEHPYSVGDIYPRSGMKVSAERFAELAGKTNKQGVPLIKQVAVAAVANEINEATTATPTAKKSGKKTKKAADK